MKRSMRKQAILLSAAMLLSMAGCKNNNTEDATQETSETGTKTTQNETDPVDETKGAGADSGKSSSQEPSGKNLTEEYTGAELPEKSDYKANTALTDTSDKYMLSDESEADAVITFSGKQVTVTGDKKDAVLVGEEEGICVVTITKGGVYRISGSSENGRVNVDAGSDMVWLVLNGVDLTADVAPIYVAQADKTILTLAKNSENKLADRSEWGQVDEDSEDVDGVIYSKDDLIINGSGALTIKANYDKGIHGKDDLRMRGGTITVDAAGDAIQGNDSIEISAGAYNVTTKKDGFVTKTTDKEGKGYLSVSGGTFTINADGDGFTAATDLKIEDGAFTITTGGGTANAAAKSGNNGFGGFGRGGNTTKTSGDTTSSKGLKAENTLSVSGGIFTIDSKDDAVHSDHTIVINGTSYMELSTGDDAVHAEESLTLDENCYVQVLKSYEGYESANIYVKGGWHRIMASDDGVNASGGTSTGSTQQKAAVSALTSATVDEKLGVASQLAAAGYFSQAPADGTFVRDAVNNSKEPDTEIAAGDTGEGRVKRPEGPGGFGTIGGGNQLLEISGGYLFVNAGGDGLDSNGNLNVTGGITVVAGPTDNGNGPLDCGEGNTVSITGGILLAAGSTGMMERPEANYVACTTLAAAAETQITIADEKGNVLVSFVTPKKAQGLIASANGKSSGYKIYTGGNVTGKFNEDRVCVDGTISGGKETAATDITGFEGFGGRGGRGGAGNKNADPFEGLPEDWQDRIKEGLPEDWQDRLKEGLPEDWQDRLKEGLPEDWQDRLKEELPEDWQERFKDELPDGWEDFFKDKLPEDWEERIREAFPDDLPERFKDALPGNRDGKNGGRTPKNDNTNEEKSDGFTA